ncbi:uncharacterized protein [Amphiura filiformis]|uniref:uncharacterized protein n=1 Tax=Amphiura filiformis TaxID=82378 RepID=UPI003B21F3E3
MPSSVLSTYNCDKTTQASHWNHIDANGPPCGRFSPVVEQLQGHARTPRSPRKFTPACVQPVNENFDDAATKQTSFRPAPDGQSVTSPTQKRRWLNKSSNNVSNDVPALPPQVRRDGRGMSPVRLFKRSSASTSSLGSVTSTEECSDQNRLYIAPGRLIPLPSSDATRERERKTSGNCSSSHLSSGPPPLPKKSSSTSNIRNFHSPQPLRKQAMGKKPVMPPPLTRRDQAMVKKPVMTPPLPRRDQAMGKKPVMTPPLPRRDQAMGKKPVMPPPHARRDHLPPPLVLTPPEGAHLSGPSSPIGSPGPPHRIAPSPPGENKRLSPLPPSCQDPSSPKLPPKPAHLKSSPATSPRSHVPFQFSYTPPASPGALSSQGDSSPPIIPMREIKLCRAPLPPPPVTSQPRSARAPLPPPKPEALRSGPSLAITNEDSKHSKQSKPVRIVKVVKQKRTKPSPRHATKEQPPRRSSNRNQYSQKVTEKNKNEKEEEQSCCGECVRDCVADIPEYLLDFFC